MKTIDLELNKVYAVHHKRKGHFKAQLIDIILADAGDQQDETLLTMKIDTRRGWGQEQLARAPGPVAVTNIRPSLVVSMELLEGEDWLMTQRVVEEERSKTSTLTPPEIVPKKSLFAGLAKRLISKN